MTIFGVFVNEYDAEGREHVKIRVPSDPQKLIIYNSFSVLLLTIAVLTGGYQYWNSFDGKLSGWNWLLLFVWLWLGSIVANGIFRFLNNKTIFFRSWLYDTDAENFSKRLFGFILEVAGLSVWTFTGFQS